MAKWSKQTYELVASKTHNLLDELDTATAVAATRRYVSDLAREFAADNPRFDADKFVKACGF